MWHGCWFQTGWSTSFWNYWTTRIFMHNHLYGLQRMVWKKKKYPTSSSWWKWFGDSRGQRRIGRMVQTGRKATITLSNTNVVNWIASLKAQHVEPLKQIDYSRRRPHKGPLLSAKKRKPNMCSPKLDDGRLEKMLPGLMGVSFFWTWRNESMNTSWYNGVGYLFGTLWLPWYQLRVV